MPQRTRSWISLLALAALAGCQLTTTGQQGAATFAARDCGQPLSGLPGCDLTQGLAQGGHMSVTATSKGGQTLTLTTGDVNVALVTRQGDGSYDVEAVGPGQTSLVASDTQEVDRLALKVAPIGQLAYSPLSDGGGAFTPATGNYDGQFVISAQKNFSLIFRQLDKDGAPLLGRQTFTYALEGGLMLQDQQTPPQALQFDLVRPPNGDTYGLLITAKASDVRFHLRIIAR